MKHKTLKKAAKYCIIGNGRLAKNLARYFFLKKISLIHWHRQLNEPLYKTVRCCDVLLLAISDSSITPFIKNNPLLKKNKLIHFSGSLTIKSACSMHPLYSFTNKTLSLLQYEKIPFIVEKNTYKFKDVFPFFKNPSYEILPSLKPYYHSLCVMAGNFSTILWQKLFSEFEKKFYLQKKTIYPYLESLQRNLKFNYKEALSGPLQRTDIKVINKNLKSLQNDPFKDIYKAFIKLKCENKI